MRITVEKDNNPTGKKITILAKANLMNSKTEFNLPNLPGAGTTNLKKLM